MNARLQMEDVNRDALTPLAVSSVAVVGDTNWMEMDWIALVSKTIDNKVQRSTKFIGQL